MSIPAAVFDATPDKEPKLLALCAVLLAAPPSEEPKAPTAEAHGIGIGARSELLPQGAVGAILGYDFGELQTEASFGAAISGNDAPDPSDLYGATLQAYYRVHRLSNADFSLGGGGGVFLSVVPDRKNRYATLLLAGARARIFVAPNVALLGTFGAAALLDGGRSQFAFGSRPLGSVGFQYYFR